jgi:8-oxo-dGTP pyrophosphatase MutT (NUDIX family)
MGEALTRRTAGLGAGEPAIQYAALPYRRMHGLEVLLLTSRDTGRWVLPKGWPMKGRKPHAAAGREALEEAGVEGRVAKKPIGAYAYAKRLPDGRLLDCVVEVFAMAVDRQRKRWPERGQRTARWFSPAEAAEVVDEPELAALLERFAPTRKG